MLIRNGKYLKTLHDVNISCLEDAYWSGVHKVVEDIRQNMVIPFCDKNNYYFIAGMGGWGFHKANGEIVEKIPKRLEHALSITTMNPHNDLGSLMQDYTKDFHP